MEKIIHVLLRMGLLIFLAKKTKALGTVSEENYNLLESINDFEVYQWLQMSILAVSMWTTKEKTTPVSLQHASSPHLHFSHFCYTQSTTSFTVTNQSQ